MGKHPTKSIELVPKKQISKNKTEKKKKIKEVKTGWWDQ